MRSVVNRNTKYSSDVPRFSNSFLTSWSFRVEFPSIAVELGNLVNSDSCVQTVHRKDCSGHLFKFWQLKSLLIEHCTVFPFRYCPSNCLTAKRMYVWHMDRTGLCTLWVPRPMSLFWIHGSQHTISSLSTLEKEEAVSDPKTIKRS